MGCVDSRLLEAGVLLSLSGCRTCVFRKEDFAFYGVGLQPSVLCLQLGSFSLHHCESVDDWTLSPALVNVFARKYEYLRMVKVGRTQRPERGREKESPYLDAIIEKCSRSSHHLHHLL